MTSHADAQAISRSFGDSPDALVRDRLFTSLEYLNRIGVALSQELHAIRPDIPIIIATGHGRGLTREAALELGFRDMLEKPVGLQELSVAVRNAIEGKAMLVPVTT